MNDTQMGTEQKVTRQEAVTMYTLNGAYLTFEEDIKGSIEPGKHARHDKLNVELLNRFKIKGVFWWLLWVLHSGPLMHSPILGMI